MNITKRENAYRVRVFKGKNAAEKTAFDFLLLYYIIPQSNTKCNTFRITFIYRNLLILQ